MRAGVSTATVSYVHQWHTLVSPDLRDRVMTAVAELDYRPNAVAQSLRQKRTRTIGLVVPDNSNPFFAEVAKGVEDAGYEAGVSVMLCNSDGSFDRELRYLQLLRDKQVDGVIFIATTPRSRPPRRRSSSGLFPPSIFYRQVPQIRHRHAGGRQLRRWLPRHATSHRVGAHPDRVRSSGLDRFPQLAAGQRVPETRWKTQDSRIDEALIFHGDNRFAGGRDGAELCSPPASHSRRSSPAMT